MRNFITLFIAVLTTTFANAQYTAQDVAAAVQSSVGDEHPVGVITSVFAKGNTLYYNYAVKSSAESNVRMIFDSEYSAELDRQDRISKLKGKLDFMKNNKINLAYQYYRNGFMGSHVIKWWEL